MANDEIVSKWLDDLRSGNFLKGYGRLHKVVNGEHQFCCLGVLCEQAVADGVIERTFVPVLVEQNGGNGTNGHYVYHTADTPEPEVNGEPNYLPFEVQEWAGLAGNNVKVDTPEHVELEGIGDYILVSTLNDEVYQDFGPIADALEKKLRPSE